MKKAIHIKEYHRKKHGRANHGGTVGEHERSAQKDFKTLTELVEMSQGKFEKKPKLIVKPNWKYATNHLEETKKGMTTKAAVILHKPITEDEKVAQNLMSHELRENQRMQEGDNEAKAHKFAMKFEKADADSLGTGDLHKRIRKIYPKSPRIFTDKELNKLTGRQMFKK